MRQLLSPVLCVAALSAAASAQETPAKLRAEVEALRAPKPPWRAIPWRTSLADGLLESQRAKKPVMLWIFIDRPVDDARC